MEFLEKEKITVFFKSIMIFMGFVLCHHVAYVLDEHFNMDYMGMVHIWWNEEAAGTRTEESYRKWGSSIQEILKTLAISNQGYWLELFRIIKRRDSREMKVTKKRGKNGELDLTRKKMIKRHAGIKNPWADEKKALITIHRHRWTLNFASFHWQKLSFIREFTNTKKKSTVTSKLSD